MIKRPMMTKKIFAEKPKMERLGNKADKIADLHKKRGYKKIVILTQE